MVPLLQFSTRTFSYRVIMWRVSRDAFRMALIDGSPSGVLRILRYMSAEQDIQTGLDRIWSSDFVQKNPKKSYQAYHPDEYNRVKTYVEGGSEPSPWPTTLLGDGLALVERGRRTLSPDPEPPPSTSTRRGPGYMRWANGELPAAHALDYDRVLVSFSGANALGQSAIPRERRGMYLSGLTCQAPGDYDAPIDWNEARANNWVMKTSSGAEVTNVAFGGAPLLDIGIPAAAQRWAERANQLLDQWNLGGTFVDDIQRNYINGIAGGAVCAKYPGPSNAPNPAWENVVASFCNTVYDYLHARGKFVIWNAQAYIGGYAPSDTAQSSLEWWPTLIDNCDGLMNEYWMAAPGWPPTTTRGANSGWLDILRMPAYVESKGKEFCCTWGGTNTNDAQYVILSMLLETKGVLYANELWPNEWIPIYNRLLTLGNATGSKTQNGSRYQRQFQGGLVWVDPSTKASDIS